MTKFSRALNTRRGIKYLALASLVVLSQACSDDDQEPNDTTVPQIAFSDLTDGQTVWSTVTATVTASDDKGLEKIEVFVDGTLLTTLTAEPFTTSWNTSSASDGRHTIKAVATDKNGNTADKSITVTVQNTLVTINISADQLAAGERGFVFLSGLDGKVLTATEYQNGQELTLKADGYKEKEFFLTEVFIQASNSVSARTYTNIARGNSWVLADLSLGDIAPPPDAGYATFNFTNAQQGDYGILTNGSSSSISAGLPTESTMVLSKNPSKLYVVKMGDDQIPVAYNLFPNITAGSTSTINLATISKPFTTGSTPLPDGITFISMDIIGYPTAGDYSEPYVVARSFWDAGPDPVPAGQTLDYFYPGNAFPSYWLTLSYEGPKFAVYRNIWGSTTATADLIAYDASFSFANNALTYSLSGEMDVTAIYFDNGSTYWTYFLAPGTKQVIPSFEIPTILSAKWSFPNLAKPSQFELLDYETIDGYADLLDYDRRSEKGWDEIGGKQVNYTEMYVKDSDDEGGRLQRARHQHKAVTIR